MRNRPLLLGLALACAVALIDQLSKIWLIAYVREAGGRVELTGWFNLVMVWNRGVSFGLFGAADARHVLIAFTILVMLGLIAWLSKATETLLPLALGLVIGGAGGNLIDRFYRGAVADFFDWHLAGWHWPAFNIADAAIVVGVALLLWHGWRDGK